MSKNKQLSNIFAPRKAHSHKGDYGKLFILAGSEGMLGAAILCSRGALRAGAGLVYLGLESKSISAVNPATPEVIIKKTNQAKDLVGLDYDAYAIGPGLGERSSLTYDLIRKLKKVRDGALVIDADGINALAKDSSLLEKHNLEIILTPHPGEAARLLRKPVAEIQRNRVQTAQEIAKIFECTVVLKGYRTVVADQTDQLYINKTGNPGMATAGCGDVLTGIIAGLLAQKKSLWQAATAGVYLHGLAGDLAAKEKGQYGMIASDLIEQIPYAIQKNS